MTFLLEFLAVLLPLTLSPGPATIALAGQGMLAGVARSLPFYFGLLLATFLITLICGLGFSKIVLGNIHVFNVLKYAGIAYLIFLGTKLIRAKPLIDGTNDKHYSFINGFTISILNPKLFIMIMALFSQFIKQPADLKYVIGSFIVVIAFSQAVWLGIGAFMKKFLSSNKSLEIMTTAFGVLLIAMSLYFLVRS